MGVAFTKVLEIAESLGDSSTSCALCEACISITPGAVDSVLRCRLHNGCMTSQ